MKVDVIIEEELVTCCYQRNWAEWRVNDVKMGS